MLPCLPKYRILRRLLVSSLVAVLLAGVSTFASATTTPKQKSASSATQSQAASGGRSTNKSAKKAPAKTGGSHASSSKSAKPRACYDTVVRKGKKQRVRVACGEPAEPVLSKSPINAKSLEQSGQPLDNSPVKARSAPIRAYAVDGTTFFHNGRKFRIEGLDLESGAELTHEHAAQRLQKILDSGAVTTEAIGPDDSGAMRAIVRVGGRDVAELMKQRP